VENGKHNFFIQEPYQGYLLRYLFRYYEDTGYRYRYWLLGVLLFKITFTLPVLNNAMRSHSVFKNTKPSHGAFQKM